MGQGIDHVALRQGKSVNCPWRESVTASILALETFVPKAVVGNFPYPSVV